MLLFKCWFFQVVFIRRKSYIVEENKKKDQKKQLEIKSISAKYDLEIVSRLFVGNLAP